MNQGSTLWMRGQSKERQEHVMDCQDSDGRQDGRQLIPDASQPLIERMTRE